MASRRQARQFALQALFHADLRGIPTEEAIAALWSTLVDGEGIGAVRPPEQEEVDFAKRLAMGAAKHRVDIDALIGDCATHWRVERMPLVDRNVLRLAGFELTHCEDIPASVSINEAIELAKTFGADGSRAFVNGIVDQMARRLGREIERGGRRGRGKRGKRRGRT